MNIVLEGPDGGGKSTLADSLADYLGYTIQQGSGPPKSMDELNARLSRYLTFDERIFDRHPAISQPIYGTLRAEANAGETQMPDAELVKQFYRGENILIYCRSVNADRHVVKYGEDPKHVKAVTDKYARLVKLYDAWACERANIIYRIGDNIRQLVRGIEKMI